MPRPAVSVVMPAFNAQKHIAEAIASIANQTLESWELLIFDDCSTDDTREVIHPFLCDPRIQLFEARQKEGQSNLTNQGIIKSQADFVAIMHSDDVAHPTRLAEQLARMYEAPALGILGSNAQVIDENGSIRRSIRKPATHAEIRAEIFRRVPFVHPSVMFRKVIFETIGLYKDIRRAPDFELWLRAVFRGVITENLQASLLSYRVHSSQLSADRRAEATQEFALTKAAIQEYGLRPSLSDSFFIYSKYLVGRYAPPTVASCLETLAARALMPRG